MDSRTYYLEKIDKKLQNPYLKNQYENYDNLLYFLPCNYFYGQRPSVWWSTRHDVDLLYGTFKYGYACYTAMR